jgi:hypothetical protein
MIACQWFFGSFFDNVFFRRGFEDISFLRELTHGKFLVSSTDGLLVKAGWICDDFGLE